MRRLIGVLGAATLTLLVAVAPAAACGGLIGPNGAVNLLRTTTFAGYHAGVEHYVTAFQFAGGGGKFGSITPLPGVPSSVEKGGDWTLQRLVLETNPQLQRAFTAPQAASASDAVELMKVRIDALDLTVLKGGGDAIGAWAKDHGFRLPPDAPEVLDFYASRSPIFLAAAFDADAAKARAQQVGDGTPVHITIPTDAPWVPLRILGLGRGDAETVEADVYLLTDARPNLLPTPFGRNGMSIAHSASASDGLLSDLRSDRGMDWVPSSGWLTKIAIGGRAGLFKYDLAIDPTGTTRPSLVAAGLVDPTAPGQPIDTGRMLLTLVAIVVGLAILRGTVGARRSPLDPS
jgi:hypothetical protein